MNNAQKGHHPYDFGICTYVHISYIQYIHAYVNCKQTADFGIYSTGFGFFISYLKDIKKEMLKTSYTKIGVCVEIFIKMIGCKKFYPREIFPRTHQGVLFSPIYLKRLWPAGHYYLAMLVVFSKRR